MQMSSTRGEASVTPQLSVVMPSYNQAQFIRAAVESVLQQSFTDLELIVVDGGSSDGTLRILEDLEAQSNGRVRWYSERDNGAADAINKALRLVRGEYIGWLNSDDLYEQGAVQRAVDYFQKKPEAMMVYGPGEHIDESGASKGAYPTEHPPLSADVMRRSCPICQPTVFFRREALADIGMLDTSLSLSFDYDFWMRMAKRYPHQIGFIEAVQAYSRLHLACKTMRQRKGVALESMRVIARAWGSAQAHWFYSWLDEFFADFPYGDHAPDARAEMKKAIDEARGYLAEEDRQEFDQRLQTDARLRVMHDDAAVSVFSDGWVGPESVLRMRARKDGYRKVRVICRHAAPNGGELKVRAVGPSGENFETTVKEPGGFSIRLDLPDGYSSPAYWSVRIKAEPGFVPAEFEPTSTDTRFLAFLVEGIELEQEAGT